MPQAEKELVPYIKPGEQVKEFSIRAVILGVLIGIVFGAANSFLGLKVGLTVTASIPAAVVSMAILRGILKRGTVLENNIVQTIGSTGESLAAGVIFTIPALIFLELSPGKLQIFLISVAGGVLGILIMIPLRHYLMVREHGRLPFPEGTACAEVLVAGEEGGRRARFVFLGLAGGGVYKFLMSGLSLWREAPFWSFARFHKAALGFELSPILLGVGYLIGPRIAAVILSGGLLGWLVLIPLFDYLGAGLTAPLYPATVPIGELDSWGIWDHYIRYIGAGGVALGGAVSIVKSLPTIISSLRHSLRGYRAVGPAEERGGHGDAATRGPASPSPRLPLSVSPSVPRTDRDLPLWVVLAGSGVLALALWLLPIFGVGFTGAVIALSFSFFFVAVSARMVGLIGTTSQPVSGMTITALLVTTVIFAQLGWTDAWGKAAAITVGAVVCIAICMSGDIAQDLKTGALVGATPSSQQLAEVIGTLASAAFAGIVLFLLHEAYTLGSKDLPAPQARLMADLVRGVMGGQLPWALVFFGVGIGVVVELLGIPALPFAIGLYLPISTSAPIIFGGLLALAVTKVRRGASGEELAGRKERGNLLAAGLVAGDALMGIVLAALTIWVITGPDGTPVPFLSLLALRDPAAGGAGEDLASCLIFAALAVAFVWLAFRRGEESPRRV